VTAGQLTLPLPNDPETQRETLNHYAVFDQIAGANPFDLFDDRIGVDVAFGRQGRGLDAHALALKGHDPNSGLPTDGMDRMLALKDEISTVVLSAYRYDGDRSLGPNEPAGRTSDRFWREALAANGYFGNAEIDLLYQQGRDSNAGGFGGPAGSNGGYGQLRWAFSPRLSAIARFDSIHDDITGNRRALTTSLLFRPLANARFTVENVWETGRNALAAAWLIAY
jgi:hypothetical protein